MSYTVKHIIDTDVEGFWRMFFDVEVARAMLREFGSPGTFEILEERTDEQGLLHRRIECRSNVELPSLAKKLVGDGTYTEVGCFDGNGELKRYSAECIPKVNADKFKTSFEVVAHPIDGGKRVERHITTSNTVKVFGIGGMVEGLLERGQREAHEQSAKFANKWLQTQQQPA
jgi:Protein of unknown function (DUF2505)